MVEWAVAVGGGGGSGALAGRQRGSAGGADLGSWGDGAVAGYGTGMHTPPRWLLPMHGCTWCPAKCFCPPSTVFSASRTAVPSILDTPKSKSP